MKVASNFRAARDVFAEAREAYTIADAWKMFGLPEEPKASCKSPFRDDKNPSFSIFNDGKAWTDHSTGDGGDVIEFIRHAIGGDHNAVRSFLLERMGGDNHNQWQPSPAKAHSKPATASSPHKQIEWPTMPMKAPKGGLNYFAVERGITYTGACVAQASGVLWFCMVQNHWCYVITDPERRAAEIRRIDGGMFGDSKAFPLKGVDKSWLPGAAMLRDSSMETDVMVFEGCTDFLTAIDLYAIYRKAGGPNLWVPLAILGAACKRLDPECADLIRGRHVRIIPDADEAGDGMRDHWTEVFRSIGCSVDVVTLPRGTDFTDNRSDIQPSTLFSR